MSGRRGRYLSAAILALFCVTGGALARLAFPDVPADHPHRDAIQWSQQVGAFQGYEDGTFKPDVKITADQATIVFGRVYPNGVTRAEFAALLYAGRNLLSTGTTTPTTLPAEERPATIGQWVYFEGEGVHGKYEAYRLSATSSSKYSFQTDPALYVRCGVGNDVWNSVFIATPWLVFNFGDVTETVSLTYRLSDWTSSRTVSWRSNEESDSTIWAPAQGANAWLSELAEIGQGTLYLSLEGRYDIETATFAEVFGIRQVIDVLTCYNR